MGDIPESADLSLLGSASRSADNANIKMPIGDFVRESVLHIKSCVPRQRCAGGRLRGISTSVFNPNLA